MRKPKINRFICKIGSISIKFDWRSVFLVDISILWLLCSRHADRCIPHASDRLASDRLFIKKRYILTN